MAKKKKRKKSQTETGRPGIDARQLVARRPTLVAAGLYLLLAAVFFFPVIFGGRTYLSPDLQSASALTAPLWDALWQDGTFPLWSPYIFCGMPSFASLMFNPFAYMPGVVILGLSKVLPFSSVNYWLHFAFAGLGVFLFVRRKGGSFLPALLGGLAFMFTPYLVSMLAFGHGSQMMTAAYIPWALWAADRLLEKVSWRNLGLLALILGFQLQRGHVQIAYYTLMLVGLYVLYNAIAFLLKKEYRRLLHFVGAFAGAGVLAGALAALLFLPLREYTPYSIRGAPSVFEQQTHTEDTGVGFDYATQWSFSPGEMMTFLIPSFYGFGGQTYWGTMPFTDYPNYMGILVLGLAITALVVHLRRGAPQRPVVGFLGLAILLALLLSFGHHFAVFYKLFYNFFPYFNKFRVPVMILILVQCSVAILAGLGLETILRRFTQTNPAARGESERRQQIARKLGIAAAVVIGIAVVATLAQGPLFDVIRGLYPDQYPERVQMQLDTMRFDMFLKDLWTVALVLGVGLVVLALGSRRAGMGMSAAAGIICLATLADLWLVDTKIGQTFPQQQQENYLQPDEITRILEADASLFRIYPTGRLFGELRWSGQGFHSVGGYHAAKPRLYQDFIEGTDLQSRLAGTGRQHIADMLNAKYVFTLSPLPDTAWTLVQRFRLGGAESTNILHIYQNPTVLPRAYLVGTYEVESDPMVALNRIKAGPDQGFDPHQQVLLTESPEIVPEPDTTAAATVTRYDLHNVEISTRSAKPQLLVLSDNYYPPGWQAYVDGESVKTYRANYAFRAVCVPAGEHEVAFRYQSRTFHAGLWTSLLALALAVGLLFVNRKRERS